MNTNIIELAKSIPVNDNLLIRVLDPISGNEVQRHVAHNSATNTMLIGIAKYLTGEGVLNQGSATLLDYVPQYISLGTMGLYSQEQDSQGLPTGIGTSPTDSEEVNFTNYINQCPGFGADGWDVNNNNDRVYFGLGPIFEDRLDTNTTVNCELVSNNYKRSAISYRAVIGEDLAELPSTVDVVLSALISTGALSSFRPYNDSVQQDYIFITEIGLWSKKFSESLGDGMLAGYRIIPPDPDNRDMSIPANRDLLKTQILRVGKNQVVQVVWKIQLGSISDLL